VCERKYGKDWFLRSLRSSSPDYLTLREADDVKASLVEIKAGKSKKFNDVEAFLKELKE
jgi:hypothetical protein